MKNALPFLLIEKKKKSLNILYNLDVPQRNMTFPSFKLGLSAELRLKKTIHRVRKSFQYFQPERQMVVEHLT